MLTSLLNVCHNGYNPYAGTEMQVSSLLKGDVVKHLSLKIVISNDSFFSTHGL